jgi:hypothetical protein
VERINVTIDEINRRRIKDERKNLVEHVHEEEVKEEEANEEDEEEPPEEEQ